MDSGSVKVNADFWSGVLFAVFGAGFCITSAVSLPVGNAFRMGPGFFPLAVGGLLALLGIVIAIRALIAGHVTATGAIPWRAIILIPLGFIGFGLAVRPIGLGPATFLLALISTFASGDMKPGRALVVALVMTLTCILIFTIGLGLKTPLVGDWLR